MIAFNPHSCAQCAQYKGIYSNYWMHTICARSITGQLLFGMVNNSVTHRIDAQICKISSSTSDCPKALNNTSSVLTFLQDEGNNHQKRRRLRSGRDSGRTQRLRPDEGRRAPRQGHHEKEQEDDQGTWGILAGDE